jgi:hypothetical protein|tara:strand:+ start:1397 stop:1582 length:186 start_codon:yes stop_codon:yes gene_type:complete
MKTFRIVESQYATVYYYYTVQAKTEEEALENILNGEVEHDEYTIDKSDSDESCFNVVYVED